MRRLAISTILAASFALFAVAARGELVQRGNLRISFDGSIAPHALPRSHPAPVTVRLDSTIGAVDGGRPPRLQRVSVAVNRIGRLDLSGLPSCAAGEIEQTSTAAALALCRGALVGHGTYDAIVAFASGPPIPVHGRVLIFNSRVAGRAALLLHVYSASPVRLTFVIPFTISHRAGRFGTAFSARIPHIASDRGYVTAIRLTLRRRYSSGGERRSAFSASCAAAPGFPGAPYTLARATYFFEGSEPLTASVYRDCAVR